MQDKIATQLQAVLDEDLKRDFPNARLGNQHAGQLASPPKPETARQRLGTAIAELEACVSEAQALIEALKMLQARL